MSITDEPFFPEIANVWRVLRRYLAISSSNDMLEEHPTTRNQAVKNAWQARASAFSHVCEETL